MTRSVEAVIEPSGAIRLLEPLAVSKPTRVLVTVVPEFSLSEAYEAAKAEAATPEASALRAAALADHRAGKGVPTAEAIREFQRLVAGANPS